MNRLIILVFVFIISGLSSINAQKRYKYEGPFPTNLRQPAEVTYTYFKADDGSKIKDGIFRYTVKIKENNSEIKVRHYVTIQGNYKNNLKHGEWDYRIMSRNYETDDNGFYYYKEITFEANYNNGYADGQWLYKSEISKRNARERTATKINWNPYEESENIKIKLNFKDNVLVDSLIIINKFGKNFFVNMDEAGAIDGEFLVINDEEKYSENYYKGLKTKFDSELKVYKYFLNSDNKDIYLDTLSLLSNSKCKIRNIIDKEIFHKENFLYEYINGDLTYKNSKCSKSPAYKGLFYYDLLPVKSKSFISNTKEIRKYAVKSKELRDYFIRQYGKIPESRDDKVKLAKLQFYVKELNSFKCFINHLSKEAIIENAIQNTKKQCATDFSKYAGKSREEISKELKDRAYEYHQKALLIN